MDLSLYLVTDRQLAGERPLEWIVQQSAYGGVTMVQLREKECSTRDFIQLTEKLLSILRPLGIPLIINDRVDVVLATDADGLHIGQNDMPWEIARKLLPPGKILGLSVENIEEAKIANDFDVDYIGISPVFSTQTKLDIAPPFGIDGVRQVKKICKHPSVAIGGINLTNARDIIEAGADGVAVVSAIICADDPQKATEELKQCISLSRK